MRVPVQDMKACIGRVEFCCWKSIVRDKRETENDVKENLEKRQFN
jgi:hypothetical protein